MNPTCLCLIVINSVKRTLFMNPTCMCFIVINSVKRTLFMNPTCMCFIVINSVKRTLFMNPTCMCSIVINSVLFNLLCVHREVVIRAWRCQCGLTTWYMHPWFLPSFPLFFLLPFFLLPFFYCSSLAHRVWTQGLYKLLKIWGTEMPFPGLEYLEKHFFDQGCGEFGSPTLMVSKCSVEWRFFFFF